MIPNDDRGGSVAALVHGFHGLIHGPGFVVERVPEPVQILPRHALESVDALLMPTSPTAAFKLGEKIDDPVKMYLADVFTVGCSLAGLPGISIPCGFSANNLPIGFQLVGPEWSETKLLRIGRAYERETAWSEQRAINGL